MSPKRERYNSVGAPLSPQATLHGKRLLAATRELRESIDDMWDRYVDPNDDCDDDGQWTTVAGGAGGRLGHCQWGFRTEQELAQARNECRQLATSNEFAINGHENRVSYIVGTGHVYRVSPKKGRDVDSKTIETVQAIIDDFVRLNRWQSRQAEIIRRLDRDGEVFLRLFSDLNGDIRVRFVDPEQVRAPVGVMVYAQTGPSSASFGIETDPEDVETVKTYYVDGLPVEAGAIQHRKANVDFNVKRGRPLFWPVRKNLLRAEKLLRNMSTVAEIQSAIALIRRHVNATQATISDFVSANEDGSKYSRRTGKTESIRRYGPGSIIDATQGTEYDFPSAKVNSAAMVQVLQAELRAVASRLVMPEFMLTSDASNANYASTMVAEGPAVKMFERLQAEMIEADGELLWRALQARLGDEVAAALRENVEIQATAPTVAVRDLAQETGRNQALFSNRILSPQSWSSAEGLDYDQEQANWDEWRKLHPDQAKSIGQSTAISGFRDMLAGKQPASDNPTDNLGDNKPPASPPSPADSGQK